MSAEPLLGSLGPVDLAGIDWLIAGGESQPGARPAELDWFRELRDRHWHDLRHEYASRLVERGVPLAQVRDLLGHASIVTAERYDHQTLEALQAAAGKLEAGKTFDAPNTADARTDFQRFFQDRPSGPLFRHA